MLLASVCAASAVLNGPALAQTAPKPSDEMERAQRDADKVFKMILINSDAPRKKRAPDAGTAAANVAAPVAAAKAPAAPATSNSPAATAAAMAQRAEAARVDTAPTVAVAPAAQLAPAPEVATQVPTPTPAPVSVLTPAAAVLAPVPLVAATVDDEEDDDSPLVPTSQVRPSYRANVLRELGRGSVRVKFEVQTDGSVAKQEVVNSSNRSLNSATLQAVGQWKFEPIKKPRQAEIELGFNVEQ